MSTTYTPAKSEYANATRESVREAWVAYEGDLPALLAYGGQVLGRMQGSGNRHADQRDVKRRVPREAAARGPTHVVFVSAHEEEGRTRVVYHTQFTKDGSCSTTPSGGNRFTRPRAGYILVRVPKSRWEELPPALGGLGKKPAAAQPIEEVAAVPVTETVHEDAPSGLEEEKPLQETTGSERRRCLDRTKAIFGTAAAQLEPAATAGGPAGLASWLTSFAAGKRPEQAQRDAEQSGARQEEAAAWFQDCLVGKRAENTNAFSVR